MSRRAGSPFGIEGIERILLTRPAATAVEMVDAIEQVVAAHGRAEDDRTVLVIRIPDPETRR